MQIKREERGGGASQGRNVGGKTGETASDRKRKRKKKG